MRANDVVLVDKRQADLALVRPPQRIAVPVELIRTRKSKGAAFTLACDTSGLEDKEIAGAMNPPIDLGTFSRLKSGSNSLDADRIAEFCEVVGNQVYSEWLAFQVGCTLVMIQSEAERRAAEAEKALAEERSKVKLLTDLLQGKAA
ncbi:MAG: hypothetical protein ABL877_10950 [Thiobacillus sp.]